MKIETTMKHTISTGCKIFSIGAKGKTSDVAYMGLEGSGKPGMGELCSFFLLLLFYNFFIAISQFFKLNQFF